GAEREGKGGRKTVREASPRGAFDGAGRPPHGRRPQKFTDPPLLWLPKEADNSAGGQVWVPKGKWGPLSEQMLHLSYGRCKLYLVMPQRVSDTMQAGPGGPGPFLPASTRGRPRGAGGALSL